MKPEEPKLKTAQYQRIYINRIQMFRYLTRGQKDGILRDVIAEETAWLEGMGGDYEEIMDCLDAMDKAQS